MPKTRAISDVRPTTSSRSTTSRFSRALASTSPSARARPFTPPSRHHSQSVEGMYTGFLSSKFWEGGTVCGARACLQPLSVCHPKPTGAALPFSSLTHRRPRT